MKRFLQSTDEIKPYHWYVLCKKHSLKVSSWGELRPMEDVAKHCDLRGCGDEPVNEFFPDRRQFDK